MGLRTSRSPVPLRVNENSPRQKASARARDPPGAQLEITEPPRDPNLRNYIKGAKPRCSRHAPSKQRESSSSRNSVTEAREDMIQQHFRHDLRIKSETAQQEEMLTTHDENAMLHLTGQSIKRATKNRLNSNTPGLHMSGTHGQESQGQLMASSPTQEGMAQLGSLVLKPPRHDLERLPEDQPPMRPLKLTPLDLPEEVREAQRKKLHVIQQDAKLANCKFDMMVKGNITRKPKPIMKQKIVKAVVGPSASTMPVVIQAQQKSHRPQLTRSNPVEKNGERQLRDITRQGMPVSLLGKPAPPLPAARIKDQAACNGEVSCKNPSTLQFEVERRRPRLRREQCLEEDQCQANTSTGGLCTDGGKLAQGVRGKGQQAEWACRGQPHAGENIKEPCTPATSREQGSAKKGHREGGGKQSARYILNRQSDVGGNREAIPESWKAKRKIPLIMKQNNAFPVEVLWWKQIQEKQNVKRHYPNLQTNSFRLPSSY
ncbi:uncharacterized protein LOC129376267 [Poeciliopsis prolifica]|uniref:uncharacterized protein LOC129376267 n=1 Tax=Poeciliopsis prolifica TaxID=188132 RepID=UPI0024143C97|nr:uncharacterized protein LOC129376267 [Poeciliopsis prolifica]